MRTAARPLQQLQNLETRCIRTLHTLGTASKNDAAWNRLFGIVTVIQEIRHRATREWLRDTPEEYTAPLDVTIEVVQAVATAAFLALQAAGIVPATAARTGPGGVAGLLTPED